MLKLPEATYETIGIYLLLAIGLKGGVELHEAELRSLAFPVLGALVLGMVIPVIAYNVLRIPLYARMAEQAFAFVGGAGDPRRTQVAHRDHRGRDRT